MIVDVKKCLIIPDVHQDIDWVQRIFAQETDYDKVVFLGDYFDTRKPLAQRTGVGATCAYFEGIFRELGDRAVFLLGNHDIQYLEAKPACDRYKTPRNLHYKCGSAYSHAAAAKIAKGLSKDFWQKARLFSVVNGWLLSHAGLTASLWPQRTSWFEAVEVLDAESAAALTTMPKGPHPFLQAGKARGGEAITGGITWLDWDDEFTDDLTCPQIVGHTPNESGARRKGRSWCLDGHQSCYGLLTSEELLVKHA